ncbi:MAG: AAA family ATPase [Thermomicrobiales bacterium]
MDARRDRGARARLRGDPTPSEAARRVGGLPALCNQSEDREAPPTCRRLHQVREVAHFIPDHVDHRDLIATERSSTRPGCGPLLFELLNELDGFREDCDVIFAMTTNRPEVLEPALSARPGRVDLAIEP